MWNAYKLKCTKKRNIQRSLEVYINRFFRSMYQYLKRILVINRGPEYARTI